MIDKTNQIRRFGVQLLFLLLALTAALTAQNTRLLSSSLNTGFGIPTNQPENAGEAPVRVFTVVGQVLTASGQSGDLRLESGILASGFLRTVDMELTIDIVDETANSGAPVDISFRVGTGLQVTGGTAYYRQAGDINYQPVNLTSSDGLNFQLSIPGEFVTDRGVEYYIEINTVNNIFTLPVDNPTDNPLTLRVRIDERSFPVTLVERQHQMISIPFDLDNRNVFEMLSDNYGEYNDRVWRIFRYEDGEYREYPNFEGELAPGSAFWLVTRDAEAFNVEQGTSTESAQPYEILLAPGWNQVATPFAFAVDWTSVQSDTALEGPYFYDGVEYIPNQTTIDPWQGYWVNNASDASVRMLVPADAAVSAGLGKQSAAVAINPDKEYLMRLIAEVSELNYRDSHNYLGMLETAESGRDINDFSEPPPIGEYVRLAIAEDDVEYAGNFKPIDPEGQQWQLTVSTTAGSKPVTIRMEDEGHLPEGFSSYILDEDLRYVITPRDGQFTIQTNDEYPQRHFRVIVGTEAFANANNDGISLIPLAYELHQNYPNPFNPETTIAYQLKQLSDVRLEIYNVLGQRVRTLINSRQDGGQHNVLWNGRNDSGKAVASGIYIYRLSANDFTVSRKMVLVR